MYEQSKKADGFIQKVPSISKRDWRSDAAAADCVDIFERTIIGQGTDSTHRLVSPHHITPLKSTDGRSDCCCKQGWTRDLLHLATG